VLSMVGVDSCHRSAAPERVDLRLDLVVVLAQLQTLDVLDLVGVDNAADVIAAHDWSRKTVIEFQLRRPPLSSPKSVKLRERLLSPNDESTNVTSRSQTKRIQFAHTAELHTRKIPESLDHRGISSMRRDNQWTELGNVSPVAELSLASTKMLRFPCLDDVVQSAERLEESLSLLGLHKGFDGVRSDDKRNFRDLLNAMTTRLDERGNSRSSDG